MIVMELADCNLWDRFRECRAKGLIGIPRDELLLYFAETAEVLDLFNDQYQLQHLDIKPQNLFLLANHVKVADFGQVKDLEGLVAPVTGGITPVYAAPGNLRRRCYAHLRSVQPCLRVPGTFDRRAAIRRDQPEPVAHAACESAAEPRLFSRVRPAGSVPRPGQEAGGSLAQCRGVRAWSLERIGVGAAPLCRAATIARGRGTTASSIVFATATGQPRDCRGEALRTGRAPDGRDAAGSKRERDGRASIHARAAGVEGAGATTPGARYRPGANGSQCAAAAPL